MSRQIDPLDVAILTVFSQEPRIGVLEVSRRLRVARGTVQARLDRLARDRVISGWGPTIDPAALGYPVMAFATLEISQARGHEIVAMHLSAIPEVLEAYTITGVGDMLCRMVAKSNADLQRVIDAVVTFEGVQRASTVIALQTQVPHRVLPLLSEAGRPATEESNQLS